MKEDPLVVRKRKQEADDLWKQLNEEPATKKKRMEETKENELAKEALEALKAMKSNLGRNFKRQRSQWWKRK